MNDQFLIAPSILAADFANLEKEIRAVERAGADWIHVDVMDGHFVPNLTIGAPVVRAMSRIATKPLDVHLMIDQPERYVDDFAQAGASYLTIHVESTVDPGAVLREIRRRNMKAGITLKPATPVERLFPFLSMVDLVLVMTVEPGFGGQGFLSEQAGKIGEIRRELRRIGSSALIEVDGGINEQTAQQCLMADVLVAGSYVFGRDYTQAIAALRKKTIA
jgi:ribulose-phosphate 3-epimerase